MGRDGVEGAATAGRMRRLGPRPGRGQLRGLGHAARGHRSRPGLRGAAAGQDRAADRLAHRETWRASKRQLEPDPRRAAGSAHRPAADDEPPLADRDGAVGLAPRARHCDARRADHDPRHGQGAWLVGAGGRSLAEQRDLFLPRPLAVRPAVPARAAAAGAEAAVDADSAHLVGGLLDRAGSLFAGDAVRRKPGAVARLEDRHPRHRRVVERGRSRAVAAPTPSSKSSAALASSR